MLMRIIHIFLAVSMLGILVTFAGCGSQSVTISAPSPVEMPVHVKDSQTPIVSFCDLVSRPQLYNQRTVRTQAIAAVTTSEVAFLYEPKCDRTDAGVDYEYENDQASRVTAPLLRDNFGKNEARRANVTVIGRFSGPRREGYGHLNSLRFHFLVMSVEKAEAVPPNVPWPSEIQK